MYPLRKLCSTLSSLIGATTISLSISFSISLILTSCALLLNRPYSSYTGTYDLLFEDLKLTYAYQNNLPPKYTHLDHIKRAFAPEVHDNMGNCAFARVLSRVENAIADPHFYMEYPPSVDYDCIETIESPSSYAILPKLQSTFDGEIFISGLIDPSVYLTGTPLPNIDPDAVIGYIHIDELSLSFAGAGRLAGSRDWFKRIANIIKRLNSANIGGLIIDVRTDAGGSQDNARFIASHFVQTSRPYLIEKELLSRTRYQTNVLKVAPGSAASYREGNIVILTSQETCSGGEMYVLAMRTRANLIHLGEASGGCAGGIIGRDLANGWTYIVTSSQTTFPEFVNGRGAEIEYLRVGIPPDEVLSSAPPLGEPLPNDPYYDPVLQRALELLSTQSEFERVFTTITRHRYP